MFELFFLRRGAISKKCIRDAEGTASQLQSLALLKLQAKSQGNYPVGSQCVIYAVGSQCVMLQSFIHHHRKHIVTTKNRTLFPRGVTAPLQEKPLRTL